MLNMYAIQLYYASVDILLFFDSRPHLMVWSMGHDHLLAHARL